MPETGSIDDLVRAMRSQRDKNLAGVGYVDPAINPARLQDFHYLSYWRHEAGRKFRLDAILVADGDEILRYCPSDASQNTLLSADELDTTLGNPVTALKYLSTTGDAMTEEFGEVMRIKAVSIDEAAKTAYDETVRLKGEIISIAGEEDSTDQTIEPVDETPGSLQAAMPVVSTLFSDILVRLRPA